MCHKMRLGLWSDDLITGQSGEENLLLAIILRALGDCRIGDRSDRLEAAAWLVTYGKQIAVRCLSMREEEYSRAMAEGIPPTLYEEVTE